MLPDKVLMCEPKYFEVNYTGNEFMKNNHDKVDKAKALKEWNVLKNVYQDLGYFVDLIEPVEALVDMVFTANQSLPFLDESGNKKVILSKMKNEQRKEEVKYFKDYYLKNDYQIIELPDQVQYFESMGDSIIDYERNIIFGGYGFRTQEIVYAILTNHHNFKLVKLKLLNPILYHLDTCFSILNFETAVIVKSAFDEASINAIRENFKNVLEVDEKENLKYFLCNCHCPDGKNVIIQKGKSKLKENIKKIGFNLIEVETNEFMKSGGSVFCMKVMLY